VTACVFLSGYGGSQLYGGTDTTPDNEEPIMTLSQDERQKQVSWFLNCKEILKCDALSTVTSLVK